MQPTFVRVHGLCHVLLPMDTILLAIDKYQTEKMGITDSLSTHFNLLYAETGGQVLDFLKCQPVEAVVISLSLDGLDAISTIHSIRHSYTNLPVILLSNYINLNILRIAAEERLDELLQIPVQADSLIEVLHKHLPGQYFNNQYHTPHK